jgi:hypothetical protein
VSWSERNYGFSTRGIFESEAYNSLLNSVPSTSTQGSELGTSTSRQQPDFGTWNIDKILLCKIGAMDPNTGAFVSVGEIKL